MQISLVGGVELVLALMSSSVPDDLFLKAVELGIVLVAAERVPAAAAAKLAAHGGGVADDGSATSPSSDVVNISPPPSDFFRRIGLTNFVACNSKMQRHFFQRLLHETGASEAFMLGVKRRLELAMQVVARTEIFVDEEPIPDFEPSTGARAVQSQLPPVRQPVAQRVVPPSKPAVLRLHTQIPKGIGEAAAATVQGAGGSAVPPASGRIPHNERSRVRSPERMMPFGHTPSAWSLRMLQMLYLLLLGGSETHKALFKEQPHAAVSVNLLDTIVKYFGTFAGAFAIYRCVCQMIDRCVLYDLMINDGHLIPLHSREVLYQPFSTDGAGGIVKPALRPA